MRGLSPSRDSSLRAFFARQVQQLVVLCLICSILCVSLNKLAYEPPELIIESEKFPRKIWQSWKVDPTRFETRDIERARTWTVKNPGHRYEVLTDDNADIYVEHHFGPAGLNRPDIVNIYKSLNAKIIKSDLLRYLIMYVEGGVYADIDVEAIRPIKKFIPKAYDEADVDMVIGIEVDEPDFAGHPVLGSKAQSFCQWTFMCKPRLPVMMRLIENIMKWLHELSLKQGKPISDLHLDFNEVLSGTGPSAFTAAILAEMSKTVGHTVTWDRFHDLTEARLVGGVLVLTVEAFAAGTGHSDSGNHKGKGAMVKHHFHASSWPSNHPRFKHPVYGEVEKCNWELECVKLWDANTAFFDALPEAERLKIINIRERKAPEISEPTVKDSEDAVDLGPSPGHVEQNVPRLEHTPLSPLPMAEELLGAPSMEAPAVDSNQGEAIAPLVPDLPSLEAPRAQLDEGEAVAPLAFDLISDYQTEASQLVISTPEDSPMTEVHESKPEDNPAAPIMARDSDRSDIDTAKAELVAGLTPGLAI